METILVNLAGTVRRERWNGRDWYVVPLTMLREGVLNGSMGPLFYPGDEVRKDPAAWNHVPIVLYHPVDNAGRPVSARDPEILEQWGLGYVFKSKVTNALQAEGWFDVEKTKAVDGRLPAGVPRVLPRLEKGVPIELSTGLFTRNRKAAPGSHWNGKPYEYTAHDYKPDHLAVLPDQVGACSLLDGCGVGVGVLNSDGGSLSADSPQGLVAKFFSWLVNPQSVEVANATSLPAAGPGRGNWSLKSRAGRADELGEKADAISAAEPTSEADHKAAMEAHGAAAMAHRSAADEASRGRSTKGATDYSAAGYHGHKAQYHDAMAADHARQCGKDCEPPTANDQKQPPAADPPAPTLTPEKTMDRSDAVNTIVANCDCWNTDEGKKALNALPDSQLTRVLEGATDTGKKLKMSDAVLNAAKGGVKVGDTEVSLVFNAEKGKFIPKAKPVSNAKAEPEEDEDEDDDAPPKKGKKPTANSGNSADKPKTLKEWLSDPTLPPEVKSTVRNSMRVERREKAAIVKQLVANIRDEDEREAEAEKLMLRDLESLEDELKRHPPVVNKAKRRSVLDDDEGGEDDLPLFNGAQGAPVHNAGSGGGGGSKGEVDEFALPEITINYAEEFGRRGKSA